MKKMHNVVSFELPSKATVTEHIVFSNPVEIYTKEGIIEKGYEKRETISARIVPNFCKQLNIRTTNCTIENYENIMKDVHDFCNNVYHALRAYGYKDKLGNRVLCLYLQDEITCEWFKVFYYLENGCPQQLNPECFEGNFIRKLTFKAKDKMSHKLWVTTDWLYYL